MRKHLFYLIWLQCLVSYAQVIENPVFDRTDVSSLHIDKVVITSDTTFVYCTYSADANSWASISGDTYLISYPSKEKSKLMSCTGLPIIPEKREFLYDEKCNIIFYFPSIKGSSHFDFIEDPCGNAFNVYGVSMSQSNNVMRQNNTREHAKALANKAEFYASIHSYEKAIEYEKQALPIVKYWFGKLDVPYENIIFNLGHYYSMLHMYEESNNYLEESLNISLILHGEEDLLYTTELTILASNYISIGNIFEGIRLYEKSLSIEKKISQGDDSKYVGTLILLAQAYQMIDDQNKALQYTEEAYTIFEKTKNDNLEEYLYSSITLANLYMLIDKEKAKDIALKTCSTIEDNYGKETDLYLTCLLTLSNCALISNETNEALSYAQEMNEISERIYGNHSQQYGSSLNLLSQIYGIGFHEYKLAINYKLRSMDVMKSSLSDIDYANTLGHLADDYAKINDFNEALHYSKVSIDLIKKISRDFEKISIDQRYSLWSKFDRNVVSKYPLYVSKCRDANEVGVLYDNFLFFKGITSKTNNNSFNWRDVQESLKDSEIAIEFIESLEQDTINCYYAMIMKKGYDNPQLFRLFDMIQLGEILYKPLSFREKNKILGDQIWGILRNELIDVENIYFSPAGIFHNIGIEYLPYDEIKYYSDIYNMYRLTSTRELCNKKRPVQFKKALLYGGLDYSSKTISSKSGTPNRSGFDYLFNTYDEVYSVSKTLEENGMECLLLSGKEGTEERFKSLSGHNLSILHMATHGMYINKESVEKMKNKNNLLFLNQNSSIDFFDYPSDLLTWSFLVLSGGNKLIERDIMLRNEDDGILTALEIAKMDFRNLDLVVLSACESGLGYNGTDEMLFGIHRGFKDAGANSIIMSLNKVNDEATKIIMVEFYKNLMGGKNKHQSLKDAQKYLRQVENGKYDKPEYWASFIMLDGLN